ncbi:MAG: hypothetical protein JEZ08_11800 [Clostridiales bacterium]|nr:hypothetical protein [Clostridiales bacterium]
MQKKGFINGAGEWDKHTRHNCMQHKGFRKDHLSNDDFSIKSFVILMILGIIGGIGIWYLNTSFGFSESGTTIEAIQILPLLICVILLIAGIFGIYDLIKKILNL